MYNIVFKNNDKRSYLNSVYDIETKLWKFYSIANIERATIFEIENDRDEISNLLIKHGDNYLGYNSEDMSVTFSKIPSKFCINNGQLNLVSNECTYKLSTDCKFYESNSIETSLEKYEFLETNSINIVVFGCVGSDDSPDVKYLKSLTKKTFEKITIFNTLNHIFHSWKHSWNIYLGFPALEGSSTVTQLRDTIDHYLKSGYEVSVYGYGYGGAVVTKASQLPQTDYSISFHGCLSKTHMDNLFLHTFGSFIINDDVKLKQYMLTNDPNIPIYTRLKIASDNNPHFVDEFLKDDLQNVIWVKSHDNNITTTQAYLKLIAKMMEND